MASDVRIRTSVFDRLIAGQGSGPDWMVCTCSVAQLRDTVARDLESLLNSRAALDFESRKIGGYVGRSVLCFGIRDFADKILSSAKDRAYVVRSIAHAIEAHEPRLTNVTVDFQSIQGNMNSFVFTIRAMLIVHPTKEAVSFDAVLQPATSKYQVTHAKFATL
jgi:type VI secretion system protein ImpF